jgi:hypothetical protein
MRISRLATQITSVALVCLTASAGLGATRAAKPTGPTLAYWTFASRPDKTGTYVDSVHGLKARVIQIGSGGSLQWESTDTPTMSGRKTSGAVQFAPAGTKSIDQQYVNGKGLVVQGLSLGAGPFTVEYYAKMALLDDRATNEVPMSYGSLTDFSSASTVFYLEHFFATQAAASDPMTERIVQAGTVAYVPSPFLDGGWHHVAYEYDNVPGGKGSVVRIYVDRVLGATVQGPTRYAINGLLKIGFGVVKSKTPPNIAGVALPLDSIALFSGYMAQLRVSRGALSPAQLLGATH